MALLTEDQDGKLERKRIPHAMTVAGSDSGTGAGIQADIETCAARLVYCSTVITAVARGGYPQAERCLISIAHPDAVVNADDAIAAFSITRNFKSSSCSHGAFLGSVLGTGIKREKVGDVIVQGENGAKVIIVSLNSFILSFRL